MAWTDQCKIAFKTSADAILWRKKGGKGVMTVLKKLSKESGIPQKTLYRWWNDLEKEKSLKNETNGEGGENTEEVETENPNIPTICFLCEKNPLEIVSRTGKPAGKGSKYHGLCPSCRRKVTAINLLDKDIAEEKRITCVCPSCNNIYFINKDRCEIKDKSYSAAEKLLKED